MSNLSHTFFCEPSCLSYVTFSGQVFSWTSHTNLREKLNILTIFFFSFYQNSDVLKYFFRSFYNRLSDIAPKSWPKALK